MSWQFNFIIFSILITAVVSLGLAIFSWRHRADAWTTPFTILLLMVAEWSLGYAFELSALDLSTKIFWAKVQYIGIVSIPLAWFWFAVLYGGREKWVTYRNLVICTILPLITLLLVFTNSSTPHTGHHLIWEQITLDSSGPLLTLSVTYGTWFWLHSAYSYLFMLFGSLLLFSALRRFPAAYRWQVIVLLLTPIAPWLGNVLFLSGLSPIPQVDLTPSMFAIGGFIFVVGVFRIRLMRIIPIARRVAVNSMSDAILVLDLQNQIVDLNPPAKAIFYRLSSKEVIGQSLFELLADRPDILDRYGISIQTEGEIWLDIQNEQRWYDIRISPLHDGRYQLRGRLIVLHDITRRKRAEENLILARDKAMEANRFKSELLAKVSHELRTPLGAILGFTEMLQAGVYGSLSEAQEELTHKIIKNTQFLTRQVNELLDLSTIEAGKLELHPTAFWPAEMIERVYEQLHILAQAKSLTFTTEINENLPEVMYGDAYRIEQILLNLIGNAIKFTDTGTIHASLYRVDRESWAIEVSDTGCGIPLDAQTQIFDAFHQVKDPVTPKNNHPGTGLGLAIVKQLTNLMGGHISLDSKVGAGSTFTVLLPLD